MHTLRRHGSITADELASAPGDYVVVDIRDASDWDAGHIAGAIHLSVEELAGPWPDPDPRLPCVVFSTSEHDAGVAVDTLRRRGRDAISVRGGADAWLAEGLPLVTNKA
jgi:rhodanese-related sulfurtransferase